MSVIITRVIANLGLRICNAFTPATSGFEVAIRKLTPKKSSASLHSCDLSKCKSLKFIDLISPIN